MMNSLAVMQRVVSPCSETTPPPDGSIEYNRHMTSAAAGIFPAEIITLNTFY